MGWDEGRANYLDDSDYSVCVQILSHEVVGLKYIQLEEEEEERGKNGELGKRRGTGRAEALGFRQAESEAWHCHIPVVRGRASGFTPLVSKMIVFA